MDDDEKDYIEQDFNAQDRRVMDQSLKRAFSADAEQDLPDVFQSLLAKLAQADRRGNGASG